MSGRSYLSIGDVLSLLREEFPDVTISKIRFLESQGLVDPERSPSGYRKFFEPDVERLRWVLRQQREHFLPLKVIRDRLAAAGDGVPSDEGYDPIDERASIERELDAHHNGDAEWEEHPGVGDPVPAGVRPLGAHAAGAHAVAGQVTGAAPATGRAAGPPDRTPYGREHADNGAESPAPWGALTGGADGAMADAPLVELRPGAGGDGGELAQVPLEPDEDDAAPADWLEEDVVDAPLADPPVAGDVGGRPRPTPPGAVAPAASPPVVVATPPATHGAGADVLSASVSGVSLTIDELCAATGLAPAQVASLESYGLVAPMAVAGGVYYDEEALTVANLVVEFAHYGIEPRHLRLYRNAVDREVGLVEQVITPLLRQRNPEARQRAVESAAELVRLGHGLRASLVRAELRRQLGT